MLKGCPYCSPFSAHKNVLHMEASDQKFLSSAKMFSFSRQKRPPLPMIIIDGLDPRRSTFYDQQLTSECLTKLAGRLEESFGSCCRFCRSQVTQELSKNIFLSILRGVRFLLTQWDAYVNSILHCNSPSNV